MTLPESAPVAPTNPAPTTHPVHELIRQRWSPRAFTDEAISDAELATLFEAATWAASSGNSQPWVFVYAHRHDGAAFQRLLTCLNPSNQTWAQHAAVLVLSCARTTLAGSGKPNAWAWHDVGAATTTLLLQATAHNLYGHVMAGFDAAKTRAAYALPDDVDPVNFIALGHLGSPEQLEEPNRTRETGARARKPVEAVVFAGQPAW